MKDQYTNCTLRGRFIISVNKPKVQSSKVFTECIWSVMTCCRVLHSRVHSILVFILVVVITCAVSSDCVIAVLCRIVLMHVIPVAIAVRPVLV